MGARMRMHSRVQKLVRVHVEFAVRTRGERHILRTLERIETCRVGLGYPGPMEKPIVEEHKDAWQTRRELWILPFEVHFLPEDMYMSVR
jgi:hypothetical protein